MLRRFLSFHFQRTRAIPDAAVEEPALVAHRGERNCQHAADLAARTLNLGHDAGLRGRNPPIGNAGSNNSSAALLQGISSISTGAGPCSETHALTENCEIEPLYRGIKKILLLEIALAGLAP